MKTVPWHRKSIQRNLVIQALLLVLSCLVTDMGETGYAFLYGAMAFWIIAAVVMVRRKDSPTKGDVFYLNYGLVLLTMLSWIIVPFIWRQRGI